jgi:hypothetical protein
MVSQADIYKSDLPDVMKYSQYKMLESQKGVIINQPIIPWKSGEIIIVNADE